MRIPLWRMVRKRAGWLIILFLGEMLTATAMASYQEELAKALVLALFLPLIVSSGGNSGSQASTLMIRAMALGELTLRDWWRVMSREVQAGLSLGVILGAIGVVRVAAMGDDWRTISASTTVRSTLAARRPHRRNFACRGRTLGNAFRLHASLSSAQNRSRSGDIICAICRNFGRCDGTGYLLQYRAGHSARLLML